MGDRPLNVLFLCTGNSARSIMAEALLREMGAGRFNAYSAGSHPKGEVHPLALERLSQARLPTAGLASKGWEVYAQAGAPPLDLVITVCDNAAGEACPVWPGQPIAAHWGIPDPAAVTGSHEDTRRAFSDACATLAHRIRLLTGIPLETLDRPSLQSRVRAIGSSDNLR